MDSLCPSGFLGVAQPFVLPASEIIDRATSRGLLAAREDGSLVGFPGAASRTVAGHALRSDEVSRGLVFMQRGSSRLQASKSDALRLLAEVLERRKKQFLDSL